jgi:hypothetical protein
MLKEILQRMEKRRRRRTTKMDLLEGGRRLPLPRGEISFLTDHLRIGNVKSTLIISTTERHLISQQKLPLWHHLLSQQQQNNQNRRESQVRDHKSWSLILTLLIIL